MHLPTILGRPRQSRWSHSPTAPAVSRSARRRPEAGGAFAPRLCAVVLVATLVLAGFLSYQAGAPTQRGVAPAGTLSVQLAAIHPTGNCPGIPIPC